VRVSLTNSGRGFSVAPGQSVLDAALQSGLNLPHSCKGGNCGACRARLLSGDVRHANGTPLGLSAGEIDEGFILLCQARADSDLSIEVAEISRAADAVIKRLPCRIERVEWLAHDVLQVFLRLPAAEAFDFLPGQYVDIVLSGGRRRSFSIASPPHDARFLELHVRRVAGGEFTEPLFTGDPRHSLLTLEGPLGQFVYHSDSNVPMLLIGGGTGLAPLKSIMRHVIELHPQRQMLLFWGVRNERDLYAHAELLEMERSSPNIHYQAVLSDPGAGWAGARGWVHEAALRHVAGTPCDIYASGPPQMIAAVQQGVRQQAAGSRLFFDSFDYAPDSLERQRTSAATKS
jgi:CDP-4-dehydro-6-deoxyglucose reductase, E3